MNPYTDMTIQQFIDMLENEVAKEDRDSAKIEFFIKQNGKKIDLDIKRVSGFSISPDIVVELEEVEKPIMKPANFKMSFIDDILENEERKKNKNE